MKKNSITFIITLFAVHAFLLAQDIKSIPIPDIPVIPQITTPTIESTDSFIDNVSNNKVLLDIINSSFRKQFIIVSYCIPQQMELKSGLDSQKVRQLGLKLYLSFQQYKDNLMRLKDLILKPVSQIVQQQFNISKQNSILGALVVIDFLDRDNIEHNITLTSNLIQIDKSIYESSKQILNIFQMYFCHPYTITRY